MGFQTTLTILNDAMNEIDADPVGWWEKTRHEIMNHRGNGQKPNSYGFKGYSNAFSVASFHHASVTSVIAVGGNHASILGQFHNQAHHTEEYKLELLKKMANELGYSLTKKRTKKEKV